MQITRDRCKPDICILKIKSEKRENRMQITGNEGKGLFASDFGYEVLNPPDLVFRMQITLALKEH